jgi:hypothetical protein
MMTTAPARKSMAAESERGMATLEVLPIIFIFVFLLAYTLGMFGAIHTGIMQSISARTYAFETFRNRTNLWYFRDLPGRDRRHFRDHGNRFHAIMQDVNESAEFHAAARPIRMGIPMEPQPSHTDPTVHNDKLFTSDQLRGSARNQIVDVGPIWIMVQYGMCMRVSCGDKK